MKPAGAAPAGTIYDIGYQRYDGVRLGRTNAVLTLIGHGMRTVIGSGRGDRAKIVPAVLLALALIPAVIQAWVAAATGDLVRLVSYHTYFQQIEIVFLLFCAAQAPELVSTDQQQRVLPLYFSRPVHRLDYAAGKLVALFLALFLIGTAGQLTLFAGRVFGTDLLVDGWTNERSAVLPILITTAAGALLMASLSLAIAACIRARTMATAAIVATFLVLGALTPLLWQALSEETRSYTVLAGPLTVMSGFAVWMFDAEPRRRSIVAMAALPGHWYAVAIGAFIVVALAALMLRYRTLRA